MWGGGGVEKNWEGKAEGERGEGGEQVSDTGVGWTTGESSQTRAQPSSSSFCFFCVCVSESLKPESSGDSGSRGGVPPGWVCVRRRTPVS